MLPIDFVATLGLEGLKNHLVDEFHAKEIKNAIISYVEKEQEKNYFCSSQKEIDFGGLAEYLCSNFSDDMEKRLTGKTAEIRGQAHKSIVEKATSYAQAKTPLQVARVKKIVSSAMQILHKFYEKKLSRELKYLSARISEDVVQASASQHEMQTKEIVQALQERELVLSLPKQAKIMAEEGKLDLLSEVLTDFTESVSLAHKLKPYFGFEPQTINGEQKFISVPLTEEARRLYPPHLKCNGRAYIGEQELGEITPKIIEYANNHQLPIRLVVEDARKFLGSHIDPQQCEAEMIVGEEIMLLPKPFPEAMAYSIIIDDTTIFEYILLRTKERLEDGSLVFSNESQNTPFVIYIKANPCTRKVNFSFSIKNGSNSDHLKYSRLLKAIRSHGRLKIHHLESGKNLIEVSGIYDVSCEYIDRLDAEIAFLENILTLEKYFGREIKIPEQFSVEEVQTVNYVAAILRKEKIRGKWSRYETSITIVPTTKANITSSSKEFSNLTYIGSASVDIFDQHLVFPFMRTFSTAKLEDPEKTSRKLEVLEEGDTFKITLIPGTNDGVGEYIDTIYEPDSGMYSFIKDTIEV